MPDSEWRTKLAALANEESKRVAKTSQQRVLDYLVEQYMHCFLIVTYDQGPDTWIPYDEELICWYWPGLKRVQHQILHAGEPWKEPVYLPADVTRAMWAELEEKI